MISDRPHKITMYGIGSNVVHIDDFATMEDASRTYGNMCTTIRERKDKKNRGINSRVYRIVLSTEYSEFHVN